MGLVWVLQLPLGQPLLVMLSQWAPRVLVQHVLQAEQAVFEGMKQTPVAADASKEQAVPGHEAGRTNLLGQ